MIDQMHWVDNRLPPVRSSIWKGLVRPLFNYLASPRTIDEILEWGAIRRYSTSWVNNMLAYLSFTGKVRHDAFSARWMRGSDFPSYLESWRDHRLAGAGAP